MIIKICDVCNKEVKTLNNVDVPCHLFSRRNDIGYVDLEMNRVSGRMDIIECCNDCSNRLYSALVQKYDQLKEQQ